MKKKGIILISCYLVIAVLIIFGAFAISKTVSEGWLSQRYNDTMKAFYLAEAGIETARKYIIDNGPSVIVTLGPTNLGEGNYTATITPNYGGNPKKWTVDSTGTVNSISKTIKTIIDEGSVGAYETLLRAIYSRNEIKITGNATISPEGSYQENVPVEQICFETTFGMTKDEMKARAYNTYTDPPINQLPVDKITWVECPGGEFKITDDSWIGTDILIVNGDFRMTGGTFEGVIWVIGDLKATGNAAFKGSIFVEGESLINAEISGNTTFTFDGITVRGAYVESGLITAPIFSWQEE